MYTYGYLAMQMVRYVLDFKTFLDIWDPSGGVDLEATLSLWYANKMIFEKLKMLKSKLIPVYINRRGHWDLGNLM